MKLFVICVVLATFGQAVDQMPKIKRISIRPTKVGNTIPENKLAEQCEVGNGILVQQRSMLCGDPECKVKPEQMKPGNDIVFESEIIPSKSMKYLGYRVTFTFEGKDPVVVFDDKVPSSAVVAGSSYIIQLAIEPVQGIKGKLLGRYEMYDFADKAKPVDVCVQVQFEFL